MTQEKLIHVGTFGKPSGLKGEIKIITFTSDTKSLFSYKPLLSEDGIEKWSLIFVRISNGQVIVKMKDMITADSVKHLIGKKIYVKRKNLPQIEKSEFYYVDLVNCKVVTTNNKVLGSVNGIENFNAGDLINVKSINRQDFYLPVDKDNIISIDLQKKIIIVNPLKGIID